MECVPILAARINRRTTLKFRCFKASLVLALLEIPSQQEGSSSYHASTERPQLRSVLDLLFAEADRAGKQWRWSMVYSGPLSVSLGVVNMSLGADLYRGGAIIRGWDPNYISPDIQIANNDPYGTQWNKTNNDGVPVQLRMGY